MEKLFNSLVSPKGTNSWRAVVTLGLFLIWDRQGKMAERLAVLESRLTTAAVAGPAATNDAVRIGSELPRRIAAEFGRAGSPP